MFLHDYVNAFIDLSTTSPEMRYMIHNDFHYGLTTDLKEAGVASNEAWTVTELLWTRMLHPMKSYHTPVHILSIFQWASKNQIELTIPERLAIWFHDAVYVPTAPQHKNENRSASFMLGLLDGLVSPSFLDFARNAIVETANHCLTDVNARYHRVLDLDIFMFSLPRNAYLKMTQCIRQEYPNITQREFARGRTDFLSKFVAKGFVYRTPEIRDLHEANAIKQIELEQADWFPELDVLPR